MERLLLGYFCHRASYIASNDGDCDYERWVSKDLEGGGCGLFHGAVRHSNIKAEKIHDPFQKL
jgi:hypothetical protein